MLYTDRSFEMTQRTEEPADFQKPFYDQMVAVSKSFIKTFSLWDPEQKSLFIMCLTKIRWTETGNSNVVEIGNQEAMEVLKLKLDKAHQSEYLRKAFSDMAKKSWIKWTSKEDKEIFTDGFLITTIIGVRGRKKIVFNPEYMSLLEGLKSNFITIWTTDAFSFKNPYAWDLFIELRLHCDTRKTNYRTYTTNELRSLFGLDEEMFIRKDGCFDRTNFEKRVLDRAITEINSGDMLQILPSVGSKHKFYTKEYEFGYVTGYTFKYIVRTRQVPSDQQIDAAKEDYQLEGQMDFSDYPEILPETEPAKKKPGRKKKNLDN